MKRAGYWLGGAAMLLLLLAALLLATTAPGLRLLVAAATALSQDRLRLEGVEGKLIGPISVASLTLDTEMQRLQISRMRLEWRPRALWRLRFEIDTFAAHTLSVEETKPDPSPLLLPASLRLPLDIVLHRFDIDELRVVQSGQTVALDRLHGSLDGSGGHYRLSGFGATAPWAELSGELDIAQDAPFALHGKFAARRQEPAPVAAQLALGGELAALDFTLEAGAKGAQLRASGKALPFPEFTVPDLLLAGHGIDPRLWSADAPQADLAFSGKFEYTPDAGLSGAFSLDNRLAGRLDQGRLPLTHLQGVVSGDAAQADFEALRVDMGKAGSLAGRGQWRDDGFHFDLGGSGINLSGLHSEFFATRLSATLRLEGDAAQQSFSAQLADKRGSARLKIVHADGTLQLESAVLNSPGGQLNTTGRLQLDAPQAFALNLDATRLDPSRLGNFPRGQINVQGEASGVLLPQPRVQATFTLPRGSLEDRPIEGRGRFRLDGRQLSGVDVDIDLAGNLANVKGGLGKPGDSLAWNISAPDLARLSLGLSGQLSSSGKAGGTLEQLQIEASLQAANLRLPGDVAVERAAMQLTVQAAEFGLFAGQLEAHGVQLGGTPLDTVHVRLNGRRDAHTLELDAQRNAEHFSARLAGGVVRQEWRGELRQASLDGEWPMALKAPVRLVLSREHQQLEKMDIALAGGRIFVERFEQRGASFSSRGTLADLPLAPVLALLQSPARVTTDLRVDGEWDVRLDEMLAGHIRVTRKSGDVHLLDPVSALGLSALALEIDAEAGLTSVRLAADMSPAGSLRVEGRGTLAREGNLLVMSRTAPLDWNAQIDLPDLHLLRPFIMPGVRADARLQASLQGSGSLAHPVLDGQLSAEAIRFSMPQEGVAITDGVLKLQLADNEVRVNEGVLYGARGRILVGGSARLSESEGGLKLDFEQFSIANRSDRRLVITGSSRLTYTEQRLRLEGELSADQARLEMTGTDRPELSPDVVVVGQAQPGEPEAQRIPLVLDLRFRLGNDFLFKGEGLDAQLSGELRVYTENRLLRGEGRIQVERGRYTAYARPLTIERGAFVFAGPIDDPGLDMLAVRTMPTVKAGVLVSGTMLQPVVKLYSEPPMPDTETLSWLVLGHGIENGGQENFALLQMAASTLLSQSESVAVQGQLADVLQIDTFEVRTGDGQNLATSTVNVGKRISSRTTVSYEQTLVGLSQVVKVVYQLSPKIRLETRTSEQSSIDAFFVHEFD
ncbi:MAG: translocation/assembly module TamB domain-containing protein [Sideroxyarcus sp.]|nr:translocation/assembly module TamB domain-containing protein [Sideroxyarcus sp.]